MMAKKKGRPAKAKETAVATVEKASTGVAVIASVDPQALLAQAIDKNLPIESMERLLAMRREMKAEWARDQFFTALAGFQRECPIVEKKRKVMDRDKVTKAEKGLRYSYAAIEDLTAQAGPAMERWGFSWTCKPAQTDGHVKAIVYAHHKDGHMEITEFEIPIDPDAYMSDPQKAAAALTFATRYAFKAAFGIQTKGEDNDVQRSEEEPRRKGPITPPREKAPDAAIPVKHEEKKPETGVQKIERYLKATETDPKSKSVVSLFTANEQLDYTHEANMAKDNPAELEKIMADIIATGAKRRKTIKGE